MFVDYKYTDEEFAQWVLKLYDLFPQCTPEVVRKITNAFLKGNISFDKSIGIVNYTTQIENFSGIYQK